MLTIICNLFDGRIDVSLFDISISIHSLIGYCVGSCIQASITLVCSAIPYKVYAGIPCILFFVARLYILTHELAIYLPENLEKHADKKWLKKTLKTLKSLKIILQTPCNR